MKFLHNNVKSSWMLKYGTTIFLPHHMNSILAEAWDAFKVSSGKIIRDSSAKKNLRPLSYPDFTTNNQACVVSTQVSSEAKDKYINTISHRTVEPIKVKKSIPTT